jgi:hypothetical protein
MMSALSEYEVNFQHGSRELEAGDKLRSQGKVILDELEIDVQKRLWDSTDQGEDK